MGDATYVLWLEGIDPGRLDRLPAMCLLAQQGVDVRLTPAPLIEKGTCYYQTLTGMGAGQLGRFDAVYPVAYQARNEDGTPEGAWNCLLPDVLRQSGLTMASLELGAADALAALPDVAGDCVLVRVRAAERAPDDVLDALVRSCAERAEPHGHVVVLTDVWSPPPRQFVNINDFLGEIGLLERQPGAHPGGEIVWSETLAYGLGAGQLWLNLRGREPQGIVAPGREYDDVRAALIAALYEEWRDAFTGEPVVAQVLTKEEAYSGKYLFKAPDLIVVYHPGYASSPRAAALKLDGASIQPHDTASRDDDRALAPYARLVARGPALAGGCASGGQVLDVVPSLLYLLGQPVPAHVDGRVITEIFSLAYRQRMPLVQAVDGSPSLSAEEEGAIMGRLQALGYLG